MTELDVAGSAIRIGRGALASVGLPSGRRFVVSEPQVWRLHGAALPAPHHLHLLPRGEAAKSWDALRALLDAWIAAGLRRDDLVVALGGGAVSDLAGFAAAVALRGVRWAAVPTTLNAQADAAVGGKTGLNAGGVKNWAGAFHAPGLVLIDPDLLPTLPAPELRAGYAEVAKCGLAGDAALWRWCEEHGADVVAGAPDALAHAVGAAVRFKAELVGRDPFDRGERRLLNLGHSFGHAIEAATGFRHGEAVAIGCVLAFDLSARMGLCPAEDAARVRAHFEAVGLPTDNPVPTDTLITLMTSDKKNVGGGLTLILARGIGRAFVAANVPVEEVRALI